MEEPLTSLSFVTFYFIVFMLFEGTGSSCTCMIDKAQLADIMDCNVIIGGKERERVH